MNIFIIAFAFLLQTVHASDSKGNGGDGVFLNSKFYLLDLVEEGLHENPQFETGLTLPESLAKRAFAPFTQLDIDLDLLQSKLAEINQSRPVLARLIIKTFEKHNWLLRDLRLRNVEDENTVIAEPLFQIALRQRFDIYIDKKFFDQLDEKNKIALIFHEAIYAMSSKEKQGKIITSSWVARRINAKLFKQLNKSNWQEIEREAQTYLPIPNAPQVTHEKEELVGYTDTFFAEARYLWYGINGRYEGIHEEKVRFERSTPLDQVKVKIRNICRRPRATEASYEHSSTLIEYGTYAVSHSLKEHKEGFHLKIVKGIHMLGQKRNDVESSSACRKALLRVYHQLKK